MLQDHTNRITWQHEQRSSGELRQLGTRSASKLATLYCWLSAARWGGGGTFSWPWRMQFFDGYFSISLSSTISGETKRTTKKRTMMHSKGFIMFNGSIFTDTAPDTGQNNGHSSSLLYDCCIATGWLLHTVFSLIENQFRLLALLPSYRPILLRIRNALLLENKV